MRKKKTNEYIVFASETVIYKVPVKATSKTIAREMVSLGECEAEPHHIVDSHGFRTISVEEVKSK